MRIIAIVNHKGGVGKTTTTLNLGKALSLQGKKVLLIDLDPQANLSQAFGVEHTEKNIYHSLCHQENLVVEKIDNNLFLVPSDLELSRAENDLRAEVNGYFKLKRSLKSLDGSYDFILIDCPPSLGIITINALIAAQEVIIVLQAQFFAVKGLQTIFDMVSNMQEELNTSLKIAGLLLAQVESTVLNKTMINVVNEGYGKLVFHTTIRKNTAIGEAALKQQDIFTYQSKSAGAEDYMNLANEILSMV